MKYSDFKNKTYYEILEIEQTASMDEIKAAYRKCAKKYHPDMVNGADKEEAEKIMKLVNEANSVLSNENSRKAYDRELQDNSADGKSAYEYLDKVFNAYNAYDAEINSVLSKQLVRIKLYMSDGQWNEARAAIKKYLDENFDDPYAWVFSYMVYNGKCFFRDLLFQQSLEQGNFFVSKEFKHALEFGDDTFRANMIYSQYMNACINVEGYAVTADNILSKNETLSQRDIETINMCLKEMKRLCAENPDAVKMIKSDGVPYSGLVNYIELRIKLKTDMAIKAARKKEEDKRKKEKDKKYQTLIKKVNESNIIEDLKAYKITLEKEFCEYSDCKSYIKVCDDKITKLKKASKIRKIVLLLVVIGIISYFAPSIISNMQPLEPLETRFNDLEVGDTVVFGNYNGRIKWKVLDIDGDKILLFSEKSIISSVYNYETTNVSWETSTIRKWLNNGFYDSAFDSTEKELIQTTLTETEVYELSDGYKYYETQDLVFLLSLDLANKYYETTVELCSMMSQPWWINQLSEVRDSGKIVYKSRRAYCYRNGSGNSFGGSSDYTAVNETGGVYPAIWIDISNLK